MTTSSTTVATKVAQVTLGFWIIKICATTLGETGGDQLSTTMGLGYAASTAIFLAGALALVAAQIAARRYHQLLYWAAMLSTTMAGTTLSDYIDRTAHLGYAGGSLVLAGVLIAVMLAWRLSLGAVAYDRVADPRVEGFYWATIFASNTLGTALGDFMADGLGLGYVGSAAAIVGLLAAVAAAFFFTRTSRTLLFWLAFVLTRPLGATLGDALTKSHDQGGLGLGTLHATVGLAAAMIILVGLAASKLGRSSVPDPVSA